MRIKPFLDNNFLLQNRTAEILYHEYAAQQPIIDYHNHLSPQQIAEDHQFDTITSVWLNGDHYKWRAMRAQGINEQYITGNASDQDKFRKWAETVPYTMRNPLYHWTHLELQRYFGIDDLLSPSSCDAIYEKTNACLSEEAYTTQQLLHKINVKIVCTTDDPVDDLAYHKQHATGDSGIQMYMAFRPDAAMLLENKNYLSYLQRLSEVSGIEIDSYTNLVAALLQRIQYFHTNGCRISDHSLNNIPAEDYSEGELGQIFEKRMKGKVLTPLECEKMKSAILFELSCAYADLGWVQQFHLGPLRNNNDRMLHEIGPDTGFDSIGDFSQASQLSRFLNRLDKQKQLAKTILYNLNPRDNEVLATMIGNYNDESVRGKMQYGAAWWFLDQKDGMEKQLNVLSNMGLLSGFIGMLTDSRSFLSFPRHEYFRRILCNLIGRDVHNGELPNDIKWLGKLVSDISYNNAKAYFGF